ncbi:MAG: RelA/SpoT family protein [Acidibacter sp.]|nr:RelA/SpoT family protein [Acidibacter sp.]
MQIAEPVPEALNLDIERWTDALRHAGASATHLRQAQVAARVVAHITEDTELTCGVLLHEAAIDSAQVPTEFGAASRDVAEQLARLGDFGGSMRWEESVTPRGSQAETLRKMLLAVVSDPRLIVARIAIQLARLRLARDVSAEDRQRLANEARAVFAPLAHRLGVWQVKWELEDLAFRYLEPEAYKAIAKALAERRADREAYIARFVTELRSLLAAQHLHAEVQGRAKHIYSIHRKMQRKRLTLDQLYDLRAVRIVCESLAECYAALGVVHGHWPYIRGEFDDYIATPKDNFYRSIHTAVIGPTGVPVEVQIRTLEMHQQAELGVAAHWRYKEGGARDASFEKKIEWVRRLLDTPEATSTGDQDFLDRVRAELFEDRVYALTPRGEVVDLPQGATPLDFAYQVHTSLGHRCRGAKVNGRIVTLTQPLANGQVVEIITSKLENPSRDWLTQEGFLVSPRSRAKLRSWFRRLDASENEAAGRQLLERELAKLGVGLDLVPALAADLKAGDASQLYRWVGEGETTLTQVAAAVLRRVTPKEPAPAQATVPRRTPTQGAIEGGPITLEGIGNLPMTFGKCCTPVPPEPVTAYITLSRGITVHAERCSSLQRMRHAHPERCLTVNWSIDPKRR